MARKRTEELCTLTSLEDVNEALRTMGDYDRRIEAINAEMQLAVNRIKEEAEIQARPLMDARQGLETQIGLWAKGRYAEFKKVRTKVLTFGEFGFRQSTSVRCPTAPDMVLEIVEKLREMDMADCIKTTPDAINRAALRTYDAERVKAAGCELVIKDTFFCEPAREALPE